MLSPQHLVLNREAGVAAELIASGVSLLGRANYGDTGSFGQAFFNLSVGFERAAKLAYIADFAVDHCGRFPSNDVLKNTIGHDLGRLFNHTELVSTKRRKGKDFSQRPDTGIHNGIIQVLTDFARKTRYYNLNFVTGGKGSLAAQDPMVAWNERVAEPIMKKHCTPARRKEIEQNARAVVVLIQDHATVDFTDEAGNSLSSVYAASRRTGETDIARKWSPFYVLQLARWLAFLISDLSQEGAYGQRIDALLGLDEHFVIFMNKDADLKRRRTWSIYRPSLPEALIDNQTIC